jgi:uncharacterized RDD family membrane protein YckC
MERVTRDDPDSETNQAGLAMRAVAGAIDLGLLFAAYSLISSVLASLAAAVFGDHPSVAAIVILAVLGVVVGGGIFAAFWALVGQTPGMRFLSIRLIRHGSRHIGLGVAIKRVFGVVLSLVPLGLGFLAILRDPQRQAWHDRLTGTEVIYDAVERAHRATKPSRAAGRGLD